MYSIILSYLIISSICHYAFYMENIAFMEVFMIRVAGTTRPNTTQVFVEDALLPLFINSCGYQKFISKDYSIQRPNGRLDYQILYVHQGCGHFFINNMWNKISAGNIIVYLPTEPQIYTYYAQDMPEIYWIHFSGSRSLELLQSYDIRNCHVGIHKTLAKLFDEIILELQVQKNCFEDIVQSAFLKLLPLLHRYYLSQSTSSDKSALIEHLIIELHKRYMDSWNLSSMAAYCHLSTDYFSHLFKDATGLSPISYLNQLRIEKAKEFLMTENMNISEVAILTGYKDPLYFSKAFKKATGLSPKMFHGNRLSFDESTMDGFCLPSAPITNL